MKINKKFLAEDLENTTVEETTTPAIEETEINPMADSAEQIADAATASVEAITDGEETLSEPKAGELAAEIKDVGQEIGASQAAVLPADVEDEYVTENILTRVLDRAYASAVKYMRRGDSYGCNVLISGLPGSGKTAIVDTWLNKAMRKKGLHLVSLNSTDPKIEAMVNGLPTVTTDPDEKNEAQLAYVYAKDKLGELLFDVHPELAGKCVLFVDEFNRQTNLQLRRAFMSMFNEKRNADGSLDFRKNLLFTVVCINPSLDTDKGAVKLNQAEQSRFLYNLIGADSDIDTSKNYFKTNSANRLAKLGITPPDFLKQQLKKVNKTKDELENKTAEEIAQIYREQDIDEILKVLDLSSKILNDFRFEYDSEDDLRDIYRDQKQLLNARLLTDAINAAGGDAGEFLIWVDSYSNLQDKDKEMFHNILDGYTTDVAQLRKDYGIGDNKTAASVDNSVPAEAEAAAEAEEDDAGLFMSNSMSSTIPNISPDETVRKINTIIGTW